MENNSDRMGFALIALSVVAFVLLAVNGPLKSTVSGFFNGFNNWQTQTFNGINESNKQDVTHTAYSWSSDGTDRFTTTKPNLNLLDGTATFDRMNTNSSNRPVSTITTTKVSGITNTVMDVKTSGNATAVGYYLPNAYNITAGQTITISFMAKAFDDTKVYVGFENFPNGNKVFPINNNWEIYTYTFTATTSGTPTFIIYGLDMVAGKHFQVYNYKAEPGSTATPYMPSASEVKPSDQPKYIGTYTDKNESASQDPTKYTWKLNPDYHE